MTKSSVNYQEPLVDNKSWNIHYCENFNLMFNSSLKNIIFNLLYASVSRLFLNT